MPLDYTKDHLAHRITNRGDEIGDYTYGVPHILSWNGDDGARLIIGRYCSIASQVRIFLGGNHRMDWVTTYPFTAVLDTWPEVEHVRGHPSTNGDVRIGNDVWLGDSCTIMSGVTIGDGAVVGANALVSRDVPPYAVVAGNPATVIRMRFAPAMIYRLQRIAWWDWEEADVRALLHLMVSDRIEEFVERAEPVAARMLSGRVAKATSNLARAEAALAHAKADMFSLHSARAIAEAMSTSEAPLALRDEASHAFQVEYSPTQDGVEPLER